MNETFLALLTSHILADFIFQNEWMLKRKHSIWVLLLHSLIVTLTAAAFLGAFPFWFLLKLFLFHLLIDFIKVRWLPDSPTVFLVDQFAHIAVLIGMTSLHPETALAGLWHSHLEEPWYAYFNTGMLFTTGTVLVVQVGGILIGKLTEPFRKEIDPPKIFTQETNTDAVEKVEDLAVGLKHGGQYIGWLERLLTMTLILIDQPEGIGFLITAKSILRFGEIKNVNQRKATEYIIIGTFLSFGWALAISVILKHGLEQWVPSSKSRTQSSQATVSTCPPHSTLTKQDTKGPPTLQQQKGER